MNDVLGLMKWAIGAVIFFIGVYLGGEALKEGESLVVSIAFAGFGMLYLIVVAVLGGVSGNEARISQQELEHYRKSDDDSDDEGWHD